MTPTEDPTQIATLLLEAIQSKNWGLLAAGVVAGLVALVRYAAKTWSLPWMTWTTTRWGGPLLAVLASVAGAVITALTAGQAVTLGLIVSAVTVGVLGTGAHSVQKNLRQAATAGKEAAAAVDDKAAALAVLERK